jgi:hypothetical protein
MALIIKIAKKLASRGVAFLEMYETSHLESGNDSDISRYDEKMLKIISGELGSEYEIEWVTIPKGNAFIQITKK